MVSECVTAVLKKSRKMLVLILVLVEDGLGGPQVLYQSREVHCLNPCFSGGWSRSVVKTYEYCNSDKSLNPCLSGGWSRSPFLDGQTI